MNEYKTYLTQLEHAQAGFENATRASLQLIPIFGGALNQSVFGTHDIMQIKRLEKFAKIMGEVINSGAIQKSTLAKVNEYITSDDGQEYIYLVGQKIRKIRNKTKLEYLRNFFLNHSSATKPLDLDGAEKYLDLIDILDVQSVLILNFINSYDAKIPPIQGAFSLQSENEGKISYIEVASKKFQLDKEDLDYYHQQLIANGLAIDDSMGRVNSRPLDIINITKRGKLFLNFIHE